MPAKPFENRLINEKSPYLLQHAHNPVDWHPWGEEAFNLAKSADKPIFLSIGYATCHWCHVMSHESFDNPQVAEMMNDLFVCIKVDREELPEIDSLYMEFAQALMASGSGWPLNVILTPDLKPFYAVTYMPPDTRQGMMGLIQLTSHIRELWESDERELLFDQADKLVDLFERSAVTRGTETPSETLVDEALEMLFESADPLYGGMRGAPKFPLGYQCQFFFEYAKIFNDSRPIYFAEITLDMMHRGGINDHVGGGFSRYSVDEKWSVPHFEKMLYDNALLAGAYLDGWKFTRKEKYKKVTQRILDYILREMRAEEGGFYSAEDADSEGVEGAFYLWTKKEVEAILPEEERALFCEFYDVTSDGNFEGKNILRRTHSLEEFAEYRGIEIEGLEERFERCLKLLFDERAKRTRPFKDDKILVSWNALMIDSCVKAGLSLQNESYLEAALGAIRFIKSHLWREGKLLRRYREGSSDFEGSLDDYASLIRALITLYEAGQGREWLDWAIEMTTLLEQQFKADEGAFYLTSPDHSILLRRCELYDSAQPSGNALHAENLLRLYQITRNREYWIQAEDILKVAKSYIENYPQGVSYHLLALMRYLDNDAPTFIIALDKDNSLKNELITLIYDRFIPHSAIHWAEDSDYIPIDGKTTLYLCKQGKCLAPLNEWSEMEKAFLDEKWRT
ncbi:MAG: hypothetical protein K1060chlam2_01290 [Chlamydiae bacterium]|nr:hypothetical protein [Chlamydiota bacterium]